MSPSWPLPPAMIFPISPLSRTVTFGGESLLVASIVVAFKSLINLPLSVCDAARVRGRARHKYNTSLLLQGQGGSIFAKRAWATSHATQFCSQTPESLVN